MGPRLIQLRRRYKLSQTLGELCGVSKAAGFPMGNRQRTPEIKKLLELRLQLDFSSDWLLTGERDPHLIHGGNF
ncbi:MAG: hypothetical protein BGO99_13355 [Nitrosospira sp. 56-18]|jgi:hypothetical protein|nr:hypothetical protein [Nitrosospira sp.]OJY14536.1 MAG: hypothetical protein BGO99_13355 [Nitrosospira sp. 56-18]